MSIVYEAPKWMNMDESDLIIIIQIITFIERDNHAYPILWFDKHLKTIEIANTWYYEDGNQNTTRHIKLEETQISSIILYLFQ